MWDRITYWRTMKEDQQKWVNRKRWSEGWDSAEELPGGGQGLAYRAVRKQDGHEAFLKVIKKKSDPERRARFFREASAYDTIHGRGIPRLLESNAQRWADLEYESYLATEFVEGPTLAEWREGLQAVELSVAIDMARQLLSTLRVCHEGGYVHRDVKPDNILLANGDPGRPVLVDFGLSHRKHDDSAFETEQGQEIGNRFLRLPELSAGSIGKQDPRSDVAFVGGILFNMLTGQNPDVLLDGEGCLPHQRTGRREVLQQISGNRIRRLLSVFDRAFNPMVVHRFLNAQAMDKALEHIMAPTTEGRSIEELRQSIRESIDTDTARRQVERYHRLNEAAKAFNKVFCDVQDSLEFPLLRIVTGHSESVGQIHKTYAWKVPGSAKPILTVECEIRVAGDEIAISLSGEPVFRTSYSEPHYGNQFMEIVNRWLYGRLTST